MTSKFFKQELTRLNRKMKAEGRNIILFIDNAPSHPKDLTFSNLKVKFLPANTTSKLQPLDQGPIMQSKRKYRKYQLQHLISKMDEPGCDLTASQLAKTITVYDAIKWISKAVKEVSPSTIQKCFAKCGFSAEALGLNTTGSTDDAASSQPPQSAASATPEEDSDDEDDLPLAHLLQRATNSLQLQSPTTVQEFISMDDDVATDEDFATGWDGPSQEEEEVSQEEDPEPEDPEIPAADPPKPPTISEALQFLNRLEDLCMSKDGVKSSTLECIGTLMCDLEELQVKGTLTKQSTIKSFFQAIPKA